MKMNKPTYITDLTTEIMNNQDLLNAWAENSVDMEFLELSVVILSDLDLLFSWDCNNILKIKLAGVLTGNQDFKYKGGVLIEIDDSYDFPFRTSLEYEYCINEMMDMKSLSELHKKDLINQGVSLEQIKQDERYLKMASFLHFYEMTTGYDVNDTKYLIKLTLPDLIEHKNELKKQFKEKKVNELLNPNYRKLYPENSKNENLNNDKVETIILKQLPDKWYALLYWIELNANGQLPPRNRDGQFIKKEIEEVGRIKTKKSGQGFYRSFIEIDLNNAKLLKNIYGENWKNEIIKLSENDTIISKYLQNKYN